MGRKITVLINDNHKDLYPSENISGVTSESTLNVESVTVFWDYNNVIRNVNDTFIHNENTIRLPEGYWTFEMISNIRSEYIIYNETQKHYDTISGLYSARSATGGCSVFPSSSTMNLGKLGPLIGFEENTAIAANIQSLSPKPMDLNRGLKYITVSCDIVDDTRDTDIDGGRSNIAFIPVPIDVDLKRSITQHYIDIGSKNGIPLQNGCYNKLSFDVNTNIGPMKIGSVFLELYIND